MKLLFILMFSNLFQLSRFDEEAQDQQVGSGTYTQEDVSALVCML